MTHPRPRCLAPREQPPGRRPPQTTRTFALAFARPESSISPSERRLALPAMGAPAWTNPTLAFAIRAACSGRSSSTDRARREPASRRSGTGAVSGARFSRKGKAGVGVGRCLQARGASAGQLAPARSRRARHDRLPRRRRSTARDPISPSGGLHRPCALGARLPHISRPESQTPRCRVRQRKQVSAGRREHRQARLLHAFMCRWFVNVPWLLGIDVVHM
jgi:hypothetical protein